jgi:hypothetical protein
MKSQKDRSNARPARRAFAQGIFRSVLGFLRMPLGQEMVLGCRDYDQAVKWARIECKTYGVSAVSVERVDKGGVGKISGRST